MEIASKKSQLKNLLSREEKRKIMKVFDRPVPPKNTPHQQKEVKSLLVDNKFKDQTRWLNQRKSNAFLENFHSFQIGGRALDNLLMVNDINQILSEISKFPNLNEDNCKDLVLFINKLSCYNPIFLHISIIMENILQRFLLKKEKSHNLNKKWIILGKDKQRVSKSMIKMKVEVNEFEQALNNSENSAGEIEKLNEEYESLMKLKNHQKEIILKLEKELLCLK